MLRELNDRFLDQTIELLKLSSSLDPRNSFKSFKIEHIRNLAKKFYPANFLPHELKALEPELRFYKMIYIAFLALRKSLLFLNYVNN